MSYSFGLRGRTKADVLAKVAIEFDKVVAGQKIHAKDAPDAQAAVTALLSLLPDPADESKEISLSVSGSVSGEYVDGEPTTLSAVNLSVNAYLTATIVAARVTPAPSRSLT